METYRVLLAAPNANERSEARIALSDAGENVVAEASSLTELHTLYTEHTPEAVLIDAEMLPLPKETRDLIHPSAMIVLRSSSMDAEALEAVAESPAYATLSKPFSGDDAGAELALAVSRNNDLMECHTQLDKANTRLADRVVIERAKGMLIQHERLTEPDAFKQIHFTARRANRTMRNVAEEIIDRYATRDGS